MALDAAREESDAPPRRAPRRDQRGQRLGRRHVVEQRLERGEAGERAEQSRRAHEAAEPAPPVEPEDRERDAQARGLGEHGQDDVLEAPVSGRRAVAAELDPRRLEERAELDPRRARGLAGATAETEIQMMREGRRQPDPALGSRAHQVDASARRVHLLAEDPIGRTLRQADPAVDARPQLVEIGRVGAAEGAERPRSGPGSGRAWRRTPP